VHVPQSKAEAMWYLQVIISHQLVTMPQTYMTERECMNVATQLLEHSAVCKQGIVIVIR
jgi:hypothetical protein